MILCTNISLYWKKIKGYKHIGTRIEKFSYGLKYIQLPFNIIYLLFDAKPKFNEYYDTMLPTNITENEKYDDKLNETIIGNEFPIELYDQSLYQRLKFKSDSSDEISEIRTVFPPPKFLFDEIFYIMLRGDQLDDEDIDYFTTIYNANIIPSIEECMAKLS